MEQGAWDVPLGSSSFLVPAQLEAFIVGNEKGGPGLKLAVELRSRGVPVPKLLLGVAKEVIVLEAEGVCSADALSPPGRLPVAEGELLHDPPPIAAEGEDETVPHLVTVPLDVVVAVCIEEAEEVPARRDSVDCDVEL